MGSNIHLVLEKKEHNEWIGVWSTDNIPDSFKMIAAHRSYDYFNNLAGVRADKAKNNLPKGIPDDLSKLSRLCLKEMDSDAHSHSYFSAREFIKIFMDTNHDIKTRFLGEKTIQDVTRLPEYVILGIDIDIDNIDDYRVIFYFDN